MDQQAALFGHGCYEKGQGKVTFGTGVFALVNAGGKLHSDRASGVLSTVAWQVNGEKVVYALDGGVYSAASAVTSVTLELRIGKLEPEGGIVRRIQWYALPRRKRLPECTFASPFLEVQRNHLEAVVGGKALRIPLREDRPSQMKMDVLHVIDLAQGANRLC